MDEKRTVVIHSVRKWLEQTETWVYNQVNFLPDELEAHIICEEKVNVEQFPVANLCSLEDESRLLYLWDKGLRKLGIRKYLGIVAREGRRRKGNILHSHFGNIGWANVMAAKRAGWKHVVTFYGFDASYLPKSEPVWIDRYQIMFDEVDRVLCEGPHMASLVERLGCPKEKITVHHLGVDVDQIQYVPRVWSGRSPLRVLIAGSFKEKKGIPYALEALGQLKDRAEIEITIIGDANREPRSIQEKERIVHTIEKQGLKESTRLLGYTSYRRFFEEAYKHHLFLSPSVTSADGDTEGGAPVTLIDLAATGMPIVSTAHCDIPEVIKHGESGLLASERDVDELVGHISWFIDHPQEWSTMVRAGRDRMETEFNARIQGERLGRIYKELLG